MKNKSLYLITILCLMCIFVINILFFKYTKTIKENNNAALQNLIYLIQKNYPNVDKNEVINIVNNKDINALKEYGVTSEDFVLIKDKLVYERYLILINVVFVIFMLILIIIYFINKRKKKKEVYNLANILKKINNKNYEFDLEKSDESEFSLLMNEIYKMAIELKESAENSTKDKISVKKSIEDISHQLKTPLTSINIMLDNLIQNSNMSESDKNKFLRGIEREVSNINFLVLVLLKLASFDSNTIKFNRNYNSLTDIINKSLDNLSVLIDLKDVNVLVDLNNNIKVYTDFNMEVEAITNIIKNSIEHTKSEVVLTVSDNKLYTELTIKDNGMGIDKDEIGHIFERFYKGKSSKENSFGIGLSLSKAIINKDNGKIEVESKKGEYTLFRIRYFKDISNLVK